MVNLQCYGVINKAKQNAISFFLLVFLSIFLIGCQKTTINRYEVSFVDNQVNILTPISITAGTSINNLPNPIKEGYVFLGWYYDQSYSQAVTLPFTPQGSIKLFAYYQHTMIPFSISYDNQLGSIEGFGSTSGFVPYGSNHSFIAVPKQGVVFTGWFKNGVLLSFNPTYSTTIYSVEQLEARFAEDKYDGVPISSAEQLQKINTYLSGKYSLVSNIDLTGITWVPIGENSKTPFTGTFNGWGHSIFNLTFNQNSFLFIGLFGEIHGAQVSNLKLSNITFNFTLDSNDTHYVGGLAGNSISSETDNVFVAGNMNITVNKRRMFTLVNVGGLLGQNKGIVFFCHSNVTINVQHLLETTVLVGGLVGVNHTLFEDGSTSKDEFFDNPSNRVQGLILNSSSSGNVVVNAPIHSSSHWTQIYVGGFVGYSNGSRNQYQGSYYMVAPIMNSFSSGSVWTSGYFPEVGGFIGSSLTEIINCYTTSDVTGILKVSGNLGGFGGSLYGFSSNIMVAGSIAYTESQRSIDVFGNDLDPFSLKPVLRAYNLLVISDDNRLMNTSLSRVGSFLSLSPEEWLVLSNREDLLSSNLKFGHFISIEHFRNNPFAVWDFDSNLPKLYWELRGYNQEEKEVWLDIITNTSFELEVPEIIDVAVTANISLNDTSQYFLTSDGRLIYNGIWIEENGAPCYRITRDMTSYLRLESDELITEIEGSLLLTSLGRIFSLGVGNRDVESPHYGYQRPSVIVELKLDVDEKPIDIASTYYENYILTNKNRIYVSSNRQLLDFKLVEIANKIDYKTTFLTIESLYYDLLIETIDGEQLRLIYMTDEVTGRIEWRLLRFDFLLTGERIVNDGAYRLVVTSNGRFFSNYIRYQLQPINLGLGSDEVVVQVSGNYILTNKQRVFYYSKSLGIIEIDVSLNTDNTNIALIYANLPLGPEYIIDTSGRVYLFNKDDLTFSLISFNQKLMQMKIFGQYIK